MYLNMRPPFNKVEMRQAMGWALDREAFFKNFQSGHRQHRRQQPPPGQALGLRAEDRRRLQVRHGQGRAAAGEGRYPKGQGLDFTFLVPNGYPEFKQISTMLQAAFAQLGYQPAGRGSRDRAVVGATEHQPRVPRGGGLPWSGTADPGYIQRRLLYRRPPPISRLTPEAMPVTWRP